MTNILDFVPFREKLKVNYIEIEGADCDNIEISNTMFIKPYSSDDLIIKDPWNANTPHRLNNLGLYHRNWTDFWK